MERHHFKTTINAPREKVWQTLWSDETYRQWTSAFAKGSRVETDWKTGSKVLFLDGKNRGMVSMIAENTPNEVMSFRHLGILKNGVENLEEGRRKGWSGAIENYTLKAVNGKTELIIDQDVTEEDGEHFISMWPTALERLKALAEGTPISELLREDKR
jgi:hypothetical protein